MGVNAYVKIGNRIRKLREKKGYTQKQLAEFAGIPYSTYSNYENNNREPGVEQIEKIAAALEISIDELLGYKKPLIMALDMFSNTGTSANDSYQTILESTETPNKADKLFNDMKKEIRLRGIEELLDQLNETGQEKAVEQVEMLTKIPEYRKDNK